MYRLHRTVVKQNLQWHARMTVKLQVSIKVAYTIWRVFVSFYDYEQNAYIKLSVRVAYSMSYHYFTASSLEANSGV